MAATVHTMMVMAAVGTAVLLHAAPAAPAPQQPLHQLQLARFGPEPAVGYAPGYGYGGVAVAGPAAAVQVGAPVQVAKTAALYADQPSAVAYAPSFVYKPDLSAYAAASFPQVEQLRRFDPGFRPVHTIVPKVTAVEPSVTVQKTYVDVPVVQVHHHPSAYYGYQLIDGK